MVWAPPPCGIVLEASGPECHEAEGPRAAPKWIFFLGGEGFLSASQTALPNFLRWLLTVFISFSAVTFFFFYKIQNYWNFKILEGTLPSVSPVNTILEGA